MGSVAVKGLSGDAYPGCFTPRGFSRGLERLESFLRIFWDPEALSKAISSKFDAV
jgi:hypothetical protein